MQRIIRPLACLAGFALELVFIRLLAADRLLLLAGGLPLHILAAVLGGWALGSAFKEPRSWVKIIFFCILFLGIYGLLGGVFVLILSRVRTQAGEVFHLDLDEEAELEEEPEAYADFQAAEILEVESFADILKGDDKQLRLGAIDALQKLKDKEAIAMLSDSLDSTFQEVRYYAVEALNKIAQEYLDKITILQQMVEIKPDDFVLRQCLADIYFDYAARGIEEEEIREYYYTLARDEYGILLKTQPDHLTIQHNFMEAAYMTADYAACIRQGQQLLEEEPADAHAICRISDALLKCSDFAALQTFAVRVVSCPDVPVETRQAAEMWLQHG